MSTTNVSTPYSRVRLGMARADITPPVGIYHRLWGAARHDRAAGVHRPIFGDVVAIGPVSAAEPALIRVQTDLAGLMDDQHDALAEAIASAIGIAPAQVIIAHSHSHSGGWFAPDRVPLPGGELIEPYLVDQKLRLVSAARQAVATMRPATITYATGRSDMAANRDYWDAGAGIRTCGFNPDVEMPNTLVVARVTDDAGSLVGTIVQYGCHPTTLAWENQLISSDYIGALRETVERASGAICAFFVSPCGDLGPKAGFTGDTGVADRNGRQVGWAALALLESMPPPLTEFVYTGAVVSGATLGTWKHTPLDAEALRATEVFVGGTHYLELPLKLRPTPEAMRQELADQEAAQRAADARGDVVAARDHGARAERARRWLGRLAAVPGDSTYPVRYSVYRLGNACWVTTGSEPYSWLYEELRRRFPQNAVLCSPLAGCLQAGYILPRDRFGLGLYQEEPSSYGPGALEALVEAIAERISALG